MYTAHFGLSALPFSISPDPHYLYLSQRYREALAHLIYGTQQSGGFIQLTGEVGTGKTTLTRALLEQLPENVDVALLINPKQSVLEFLHSICDELRIPYEGKSTKKAFVDALNNYLLDAHQKQRHTVLLIDEAQNLTVDILEQIRLLTNLETTQQKLLQIILVGQPELRVLLARKDLRQLSQRITARYHLLPLAEHETAEFIQHRLTVAGQNKMVFSNKALKQIHYISKGIPRLINVICDRAMLGAYSQGKHQIDADTLKRAAGEVTGEVSETSSQQRVIYKSAIAASIVVFSLLTIYLTGVFSSGSAEKTVFNDNAIASTNKVSNVDNTVTSEKPESKVLPIIAPGEPKTTASMKKNIATAKLVDPSVSELKGNSKANELHDLLHNSSIKSDSTSAFAELFSLWSLDMDSAQEGISACEKANQLGLGCWRNRGNWNNLRVVNRPAIIELIDINKNRHSVVVTALKDDTVNLSFAGKIFNFPTHEVDPFWYGSFVVLWRQPEVDLQIIHRGIRGSAALWLKQTLNKVDGISDADELDNLFDDTLETRVKAFQRERYLDDDGIVGTQTMIHLNTALNDPSIPVLTSSKRKDEHSHRAIQ